MHHSHKYRLKARLISFLATLFCMLSMSGISFGRTPPKKDTAFWKIVADYTSVKKDVTSDMLEAIGFSTPGELKHTWKNLPAVHKLAIAYAAAEQKHNGRKMLSMLIGLLAEKYESVEHEDAFTELLQEHIKHRKRTKFAKRFVAPGMAEANADASVKEIVVTIAKYTDRGGLGGTLAVLQYYDKIPATSVFDILVASTNNFDALMAGDKTTLEYRNAPIDNVIRDLGNCYASLNKIDDIKSKSTAGQRLRMPNGARVGSNIALTKIASAKYRSYVGENIRPAALRFDSMIVDKSKWGGIIVGSKVMADSTLISTPQRIFWLQDETKPGELATGTLEFHFGGHSYPLVMTGVYLEDVYAAYKILFDTDDTLIPHPGHGEGVGLINGYGSTHHHIDIHPAIANLELGRCLARADVWPRVGTGLRQALAINNEPGAKYDSVANTLMTRGTTGGWKFFAAPLIVSSDNGFLQALNADTANRSYAFRHYYHQQGASFQPFNEVVPLLCNSLYDYARMNSFIKLFAILTWAKESDAVFLNRPAIPQFVAAPNEIDVVDGSLETR